MTPSVEEVIRSATEPRALDAPCAYLNTAINLLEFMIETCTGTNSAALMDRAALASLGMEGASFDWTGAKIPVCHDLRGRPVAPCIYPCRASGRLQATAIDIAHFAAAGLAGAKRSGMMGRNTAG